MELSVVFARMCCMYAAPGGTMLVLRMVRQGAPYNLLSKYFPEIIVPGSFDYNFPINASDAICRLENSR